MITEIIIAKTKASLEEKMKKYKENYPVAGYGTSFGIIFVEDNDFKVIATRLKSCD